MNLRMEVQYHIFVEVQRYETSQSREHNSWSPFPALVVTPFSMKDMSSMKTMLCLVSTVPILMH